MTGGSFPTQIISSDGEFDAAAMQHFSNSVKLDECGISYEVVAFIGPQSSGKSTLSNNLFGTNFKVMDAREGRKQTTKGVWIGNAVGFKPLTLVMDVEGSDSQERGDQDDTTFEKQSALFALTMADILIINIWCHDIGCETAANRPLIRAVFQGMMRMFSPRKTTLLYVIRDKTKTPIEKLEAKLREDIMKIWETAPKSQAYKHTPLSDVFNVEVRALSSYEYEEEKFKKEVVQLRQRLIHSTSSGPGGLTVHPASAFCYRTKKIWEMIKQNKDLHLPNLRIMVATVRCEEIANEKFRCLKSDKDLLALKEAVNANAGAVSGFGKSASTILNTYFSEYDDKSQLFDEGVRNTKRQDLVLKAYQLVYPCYKKILSHLRSILFQSFKEQLLGTREIGFAAAVGTFQQSCIHEFDQRYSDAAIEQANWDASEVRGELLRDIEAHALHVRSDKLSELVDEYRKKLSKALEKPVESLFETAGPFTWASIRDLLNRESHAALSKFGSAVAGFELEQQTIAEKERDLKKHATNLVEETSRERAKHALDHMKERFSRVIIRDNIGYPRAQKEIVNEALHESLKLLSIMAVMRLDEGTDNVEDLLFSALLGGNGDSGYDPLASNTWNQIPPEKTLITPIECNALWKMYKKEIDHQIKIVQKIFEQEAKEGKKGIFWIILAVLLLGVGAFMKVVSYRHLIPLAIAQFILARFWSGQKEKDF